jgi:hypothetical protein
VAPIDTTQWHSSGHGEPRDQQRDLRIATDGREPPPAPAAAILPVAGLPGRCPHCGATPADGLWALVVHGLLLKAACPSCHTAVATVRAAAAR